MELHIVTKDWINKFKTKAGAWNKVQLNALGIKWPPTQGWIDRVDSESISSHNARIFEEASVKKPKGHQPDIDKYIAYLFKNVGKLTPQQMVRIRNIESKYLNLRGKR